MNTQTFIFAMILISIVVLFVVRHTINKIRNFIEAIKHAVILEMDEHTKEEKLQFLNDNGYVLITEFGEELNNSAYWMNTRLKIGVIFDGNEFSVLSNLRRFKRLVATISSIIITSEIDEVDLTFLDGRYSVYPKVSNTLEEVQAKVTGDQRVTEVLVEVYTQVKDTGGVSLHMNVNTIKMKMGSPISSYDSLTYFRAYTIVNNTVITEMESELNRLAKTALNTGNINELKELGLSRRKTIELLKVKADTNEQIAKLLGSRHTLPEDRVLDEIATKEY